MKCPDCGALQDRSTLLVMGLEVQRCHKCRTYRIKDDDQVFAAGDGVIKRLRDRGNEILAARRHREMLESDISDPRWERVLE